MKEFVPIHFVFAMAIGLLSLSFIPVIQAQEKPRDQRSSQQTEISDKELKAFAKAYVEYHKIRLAYEPSLENVHDPEEKKKIQREADSKIEKALEKQGLKPEGYNQIFKTVNSNEKLRKKALKLIEEERNRS